MKKFELLEKYVHSANKPESSLENLTPVQYAAKYGLVHFLDSYLSHAEHQAKQACLSTKNLNGGLTALHLAAIHGQVDAVQLLLSHGASIMECSSLGQLPIHSALNSQHSKSICIQLFNLLTKGDSKQFLHVNFNGDTVAHLAAALDIPEIINSIIKNNEECFSIKNNQSRTPLLLAVMNNALLSIPILLELDSKSLSDEKSQSALDYAIQYGNKTCIDLVSPHYAKPNSFHM